MKIFDTFDPHLTTFWHVLSIANPNNKNIFLIEYFLSILSKADLNEVKCNENLPSQLINAHIEIG